MRILLFVAIFLSSPIWAHDGSSKPAKNKKKTVCEAAATPSSDELALHARAISTLVPMGEMRHYIEEISGLRPLPSGYLLKMRRTDGERAIARMLLKDRVERMGYKVKMEDFRNGTNIVVELPGRSLDNEVIEVTAHYDSVLTGADDNGSGVALMLGMLDLFRKTEHERRIRIIFMDLEERGFQGSWTHASRLNSHSDGRKLAGALVVDTIGWAHEKTKKFLGVLEVGREHDAGETYSERMTFSREGMYAIARGGATDGLIVSPETWEAKPGTSDMGPYWHHGHPAVLFAAAYEDGFVNPDYHKIGDTLANMNWHYYQRMSQAAVQMVAYTARMRLKDPAVISERGWEVLREQEDKSVTLADYKLPKAADRDLSLDKEYRRWKGSSSSYDDESRDNDSDNHSSSGLNPSGPANSIGVTWKKAGTSVGSYNNSVEANVNRELNAILNGGAGDNSALSGELPLYVERFVETIGKTSSNELFMFMLPPTLEGSGVDAELINRGWVSAGNQILDLSRDSDEVYRIIKMKVLERGGMIYKIRPLSLTNDGLVPNLPKDIWPAIKDQFLHFKGTPEFSIGTGYMGNFNIQVLPGSTYLRSDLAKEEARFLKGEVPEKVAAPAFTGNPDDTIWRDLDYIPDAAAAAPSGKTDYSQYPAWVEAFVETIESTPANDLNMFIYESTDSSNRGFIVAGNKVLSLVHDPDYIYALMKEKVYKHGGNVYKFRPLGETGTIGLVAAPTDMWGAMRTQFGIYHNVSAQFTIQTPKYGDYQFNLIPQTAAVSRPQAQVPMRNISLPQYLQVMNSAPGNEIFVFIHESPDLRTRGFVAASGQILDLDLVSEGFLTAIKIKARVRGGRVFSFISEAASQKGANELPAAPAEIWENISYYFTPQFVSRAKIHRLMTSKLQILKFTALEEDSMATSAPPKADENDVTKIIATTPPEKLVMFNLPDSHGTHNGFLVTQGQIYTWSRSAQDERAKIQAKMLERGGAVFNITSTHMKLNAASPRTIWLNVGFHFESGTERKEKFGFVTNNLETLKFERVIATNSQPDQAAQKKPAAEPERRRVRKSDNIWKD